MAKTSDDILGLLDQEQSSDDILGDLDKISEKPSHGLYSADQMLEQGLQADKAVEKKVDPGLGASAVRGLQSGLLGLAEDVGTFTKYVGEKTGSESLTEIGDTAEKYWANIKKDYEAPVSLQGDIIMEGGAINWELLSKGSWWAYHVAQMAPSLAASILPATATARGITAAGVAINAGRFSYAGKQILLHPKTIERLARIGAAFSGGAAGGVLEGSSTYREVLERGGTPEEAAAAAEQMFFASGALNAISVDFLLNKAPFKIPNTAKGRMFKRFLNGATEGVTEYLEGPAEGYILLKGADGASYEYTPEEFGQKLRQEANVVGPAFVLGMMMPVGNMQGSPKAETEAKKPKEAPADTGAGVTVDEVTTEEVELSETDAALKREFEILGLTDKPTAEQLEEIGPDEQITMETAPEEQLTIEEETIDEEWGNAFDRTEYDESWGQEERDMLDLLYEAVQYNPQIIDEASRATEIGMPTQAIVDFLAQTIQEGYANAQQAEQIQQTQAEQQGPVGGAPIPGQPGTGAQPAPTPAETIPDTTGGTGTTGAGDRLAGAEDQLEPGTGELGADELAALAAEEDAALEAELEAEGETEITQPEEAEPGIEDMTDAEIEQLLDEAGETEEVAEEAPAEDTVPDEALEGMLAEAGEVAEPVAEKPEKTGPSTAKPKAAPKPEPEPVDTELMEPEYAGETSVEPEPEKVEEKPEPAKYADNDYAALKGKTVEIQYEGDEASESVAADEEIRSIDKRLEALRAFRECMAA